VSRGVPRQGTCTSQQTQLGRRSYVILVSTPKSDDHNLCELRHWTTDNSWPPQLYARTDLSIT